MIGAGCSNGSAENGSTGTASNTGGGERQRSGGVSDPSTVREPGSRRAATTETANDGRTIAASHGRVASRLPPRELASASFLIVRSILLLITKPIGSIR